MKRRRAKGDVEQVMLAGHRECPVPLPLIPLSEGAGLQHLVLRREQEPGQPHRVGAAGLPQLAIPVLPLVCLPLIQVPRMADIDDAGPVVDGVDDG